MHRVNRAVVSVCALVITAAVQSTHAQTPARAGSAVAWGTNGDGQAGPDTTGDQHVPEPQHVGLENVIAVTGGSQHSYALTADGTVWGWGGNGNGQIGVRGAGPKPMPIVRGMTAIASGATHGLALDRAGNVWAWGSNTFGEVGQEPGPDFPEPHQVAGIDHVVAIAAGQSSSFGLKDDGTVWGWGDNRVGQLGFGNTGGPQPQQIQGVDHVVAIASGQLNGIALKADHSVWGWGDSSVGQLGHVAGEPVEPEKIVDGMVAIASGALHSLALDGDGQVWGWGFNLGRPLVDGPEDIMAPLVILEKTGIVTLAAGAGNSLGLTADGAIWKWGDGNGVPTPVATEAPVLAIGAGWFHSLAVVTPTHRTPSIVWDKPAAITYGTALGAAQLNATALVDGEAVPGSFSYTPAAGTTLKAGAGQSIEVTFTPDDPSRYDGASASTAIDVIRATLTVTAADAKRTLGDPNPDFTVAYAGFVLNDDPSVLSSPVSVTTIATATSAAGAYPITPAGGSSPNYDIAFVGGTLAVSYNVCALYDQTAARKSGSTVPIKLQLCDGAGRNVSTSPVILNARSVAKISSEASGAVVDDAGNANPDANFRYDAGRYIFNLKTTGLSTGTYELEFSATGDPIAHRVRFAVR